MRATVIGGGLAGSEAAWQLASHDIPVTLVEMRPVRSGPAHHTGLLAELVCSNSFKGDDASTATGSLKRELEALGSFVLDCARRTAVPAGAALAVDRERFAALVTERLESHPLVSVERREEVAISGEGHVIVATGPLTSEAFEPALARLVGGGRLHFFDAAAPIVEADSIDRSLAFAQSRYDKGGGADYLNCPFEREEYEAFIDALLEARRVVHKEFETEDLFQACQPIEEIARRGRDAPRFGPMKPVGLTDPRTGRRPWAVVQLRPENAEATAFNLVGFQTNLTFTEQRGVFRRIPGLAHAAFSRYGVMHRNTFVDAPRLLRADLAVAAEPRIRLAGQLMGTEGYLEAAAGGLLAALNAVAAERGMPPLVLPPETVTGALFRYATDPATVGYQPMHANLGLLPPLEPHVKGKRERHAALTARAAEALRASLAAHPLTAVPEGVDR